MKKLFGALAIIAALAIAGSVSAAPVQAKPAMTQSDPTKTADNAQSAERAVTDISARCYYRRYGYGYGYRPRYYRPYGYGYGYRPYGYYGGYRRPGIYLGF